MQTLTAAESAHLSVNSPGKIYYSGSIDWTEKWYHWTVAPSLRVLDGIVHVESLKHDRWTTSV